MNEEIRSLIESLRRGDHESPDDKIALLVAALREFRVEPSFLLTLLKAPQAVLRTAAVEAASGRAEGEIRDTVLSLAEDREQRVRVKVAEVLGEWPDSLAMPALGRLLEDSDHEVRHTAIKSSRGKPSLLPQQQWILATDPSYSIRLEAAQVLSDQSDPGILPSLFAALADDDDDDVRRCCADLLERRLQRGDEKFQTAAPTDPAVLHRGFRSLRAFTARVPLLHAWLEERTREIVDPAALAAYGTDLTGLALAQTLPRAHGFEEPVRALLQLFHRDQPRSLVLVGDSGVGKSALVNELTYALARPENGGWRVLRMSPTEFMSGTRYLGEWETRVKELVQMIRRPRRILLYVPNLNDLSSMGRWSKSDANVATALAPHLEDGSVVLLGESTPEEFEKGIGSMPSLQRLFEKVLLQEPSVEATHRILTRLAEAAQVSLEPAMIERLVEVSGFFLSHLKRPGNAAHLLQTTLASRGENPAPLAFHEILALLSSSTGVPVHLLDDATPLRLEEVRGFFEERIMGQPEAVDSVVDLITLVKAGLTDPAKPFGVLLFVGPTGVGKTEIARALAEYIFGDPKRLLRFDMSEYASVEGFQRLIGSTGENGALTDAVRQQPFSVVLLDEIEKSHVNVFDLCLQLFDAGRLTDGRGRLVDFRRCILIMTSNIGAETPGRAVGFLNQNSPPPAAGPDSEKTWRELSRFFRPEFLNRIDRIVNFRPLSLEVAERIARREIDLVLQRSGITRRHLALNLDPAALALMVREGYSPHFGARPLKRTVERLLLLPLARSLTSGVAQAHSVLTLRVRNEQIEVLVVPASPPAPAARPEPPRVDRLAPLRDRVANLVHGMASLQDSLTPLHQRKSERVSETQRPGFYQDTVRRGAVFEDIRRIDQFLQLVETVSRQVEALNHRTQSLPIPAREAPALKTRIDAAEADLAHIRSVAAASDSADLGDVFVHLQRVDQTGGSIEALEQLTRLYLGWAGRKRLSALVWGEFRSEKVQRVILELTGLGAYGLMKAELGLHQFDHRHKRPARHGERERILEDREIIRVEVIPVPSEASRGFSTEVTARWKELKPVRSHLLERARWSVSLFHAPSLQSTEIWLAGKREEAETEALRFFEAYIRSVPQLAEGSSQLARHYWLGIGSKIRDLRSGRTTTNLAQVFKGHLELVR